MWRLLCKVLVFPTSPNADTNFPMCWEHKTSTKQEHLNPLFPDKLPIVHSTLECVWGTLDLGGYTGKDEKPVPKEPYVLTVSSFPGSGDSIEESELSHSVCLVSMGSWRRTLHVAPTSVSRCVPSQPQSLSCPAQTPSCDLTDPPWPWAQLSGVRI